MQDLTRVQSRALAAEYLALAPSSGGCDAERCGAEHSGGEQRDEGRGGAGRRRGDHSGAHSAASGGAHSGSSSGAAPVTDTDAEDEHLRVALALRCTRDQAAQRIRDAHLAIVHLPRATERLRNGEFPAPWFTRVLRDARDLPTASREELDATIGSWDLSCTPEQFFRQLRRLVTHLVSRASTPERLLPGARRRVDLLPAGTDGTATLQMVGPIPDILSLSRRLDAAARSLQAAQRHALDKHDPIPGDPDGVVAARGRALSLAQLRFDLLCGASVAADQGPTPAERFRINVTVPVLTLLGGGQEPGMIDGVTPIPADMARSLAGADATWYRILTDPVRGSFLPLPAERYTPTRAMLEHLRLRGATCAVPGCGRPSSWASECDHIEEYRHRDPSTGGLTEIENLHLLCWQHHQAKTDGRLDPRRLPRRMRAEERMPAEERGPAPGGRPGMVRPPGTGRPPGTEWTPGTGWTPGVTEWSLGDGTIARVEDDTDLATPGMVRDLESAWRIHQQIIAARRTAAERLARLRSRGLHPGARVVGPDGEPGWTVRSDGSLDPPRPPDPPPPF